MSVSADIPVPHPKLIHRLGPGFFVSIFLLSAVLVMLMSYFSVEALKQVVMLRPPKNAIGNVLVWFCPMEYSVMLYVFADDPSSILYFSGSGYTRNLVPIYSPRALVVSVATSRTLVPHVDVLQISKIISPTLMNSVPWALVFASLKAAEPFSSHSPLVGFL